MDGRVIDIDGREIDRFALRKEQGRQPKDFLAAVYAEEDVVAAVKKIPPKPKSKK